MPETELYCLFTSVLDSLGIRYIVTGSIAAAVYGEPRLTHDVDVVLELSVDMAEKFCQQFPIDQFYCPAPETVRLELLRTQRGHFNLIHHDTGYKADIYICGNDELHRWALDHARRLEVDGRPLPLAPPEYVILRKLEYYREGNSKKHIRDIAAMLRSRGLQIDLPWLDGRISAMGLGAQWNEAREAS